MNITGLTADGVTAILAQHSNSPALRIQIKNEGAASRVRDELPEWLDEKTIEALLDDGNAYVVIDNEDLEDVVKSFQKASKDIRDTPLQWRMIAVKMHGTTVRYCNQITSQRW